MTAHPTSEAAQDGLSHSLNGLQAQIDALRHPREDCVIIAVGVRGPNLDCPEGNAIATVRMGDDEATSEALRLYDALLLARGKIIRQREARKAAAEKAKAEREQSQ